MTTAEIAAQERRQHEAFFGETFDLSGFERALEEYGGERVAKWNGMGLEPHFLPQLAMGENDEFPGWEKKPEHWLYQQTEEGRILRRQADGELHADTRAHELEGITVLVDTRWKPTHDNDEQMWADDETFLGPVMERLREQGRIGRNDYGLQSSRFAISSDEWEAEIRTAVAERLGLDVSRVRLERAIEMNVIPQIYTHMPRKDDWVTDRGRSWVWLEEYFAVPANRVVGGQFYYGGFAFVYWPDAMPSYLSFRPIAVL